MLLPLLTVVSFHLLLVSIHVLERLSLVVRDAIRSQVLPSLSNHSGQTFKANLAVWIFLSLAGPAIGVRRSRRIGDFFEYALALVLEEDIVGWGNVLL